MHTICVPTTQPTCVDGGRREVDLETMPLYVRAGAVLPIGPIKQYTAQQIDEPIMLVVYPGANGQSSLYEDDGETFNYRAGEFMRIDMEWEDAGRRLSLQLREGSRMLDPTERVFTVRVAGESELHEVRFSGTPLVVEL